MTLTDTHTHLFAEEFNADLTEVVKHALDAGVKKFFLPNIDSASIAGMLALEKLFPDNCFAMMGLHPCSVNEKYEEELKIVEDWFSKRKFSAVGEIGMDYHWDKTFISQQKDAFSRQIDLAKKYNRPIVIHQRECFDDVLAVVETQNLAFPVKGIFHCFTGSLEEAKRIISLGGFKMGIGGAVTYKNSKLPEVLEQIDLKHIVLETDSPYLTPAPHRGKRNESSYITFVAQKVAEIKGIAVDEVAEITTRNAEEIFSH
ncbi:MAG: TatD family deoxyribonuclease [Bacteroidetes bacterium]|nr:MAG: TatD family deoxyribonuclease [Bacteroidota bacterium]